MMNFFKNLGVLYVSPALHRTHDLLGKSGASVAVRNAFCRAVNVTPRG
ncbi:MAG: hypothetical protein L0Z71_09210 [Anaerolineae bacterium]|nr:hypothetical protein [Anaerolineae bacterium]